jgi:hypothetical protein
VSPRHHGSTISKICCILDVARARMVRAGHVAGAHPATSRASVGTWSSSTKMIKRLAGAGPRVPHPARETTAERPENPERITVRDASSIRPSRQLDRLTRSPLADLVQSAGQLRAAGPNMGSILPESVAPKDDEGRYGVHSQRELPLAIRLPSNGQVLTRLTLESEASADLRVQPHDRGDGRW